MEIAPPASPIKTYFCPAGPTSNASTLSGKTWKKSKNVIRMLPIWFGPPATVIVDGYGFAGAPSVMHIGVLLKNTPIGVGEPVGVKVGVGVAVAVEVEVALAVGVADGVAQIPPANSDTSSMT